MNSLIKLYESWQINALEYWVTAGTMFVSSLVALQSALQQPPPVEAKIIKFKRRG